MQDIEIATPDKNHKREPEDLQAVGLCTLALEKIMFEGAPFSESRLEYMLDRVKEQS